jgi:hypothetical protein
LKTSRKTQHVSALLLSLLAFACPPTGRATLGTGFVAQKAGFSIKYKDEVTPYRTNGVFVMPGEELSLSLDGASETHLYQFTAGAGTWQMRGAQSWNWKAPQKPGLNVVSVTDCTSQETITMNIFVMVPASQMKDGMLNGYRIGSYPEPTKRDVAHYTPPVGFIEVTEANKNTLISPHFKLGQFVCKQESGYPKYIALRERLVYKLESLLEEINRHGYKCDSLTVMSGFRTPHYNRAIGNVAYSRHMFGDAADIYIENQGADLRDSRVLARFVDSLTDQPGNEKFEGGLGIYKSNRNHGPFVHVDTRGKKARW